MPFFVSLPLAGRLDFYSACFIILYMNKRQRERLNSLANFIERNPDTFDQTDSHRCIVGLGNRLERGKLKGTAFVWLGDSHFAERYGIRLEDVREVFYGNWSKVNRKTKDAKENHALFGRVVGRVSARRAALFLRQVAKNYR